MYIIYTQTNVPKIHASFNWERDVEMCGDDGKTWKDVENNTFKRRNSHFLFGLLL